MLSKKINGGWHRQKARKITRPLPLHAPLEQPLANEVVPGRRARGGRIAPTRDQGLQPRMVLGARVQEGGAFGGAHPLVAVAGVVVSAQRGQRERNLSRRVGAINQRRNAALTGLCHHRLDRKTQCRRTGDVAHHEQPGSGRHRVDHGLHKAVTGERQRHRRDHQNGTRLRADFLERDAAGAVLEVGGEHLVARAQTQGLGDDVDPGARIGNEDEFVGVGAKVLGQPLARLAQQRRGAPTKEQDRIALDLALPALPDIEHRLGAGAVRAMVEKHDAGIQQEPFFHGACLSGRGGVIAARGAPDHPPSGLRGSRSRFLQTLANQGCCSRGKPCGR